MVYVLLVKSVMSYCFVGFALAIREPLFLKVLASNFWSQSFFSKYWQLCLREPLHAHPWYLDRKVILVSSLDMLGLRRRQASAELPLSSLYELLDEGLEEVVKFCLLMQVKARFKNVRRFPRPDVRWSITSMCGLLPLTCSRWCSSTDIPFISTPLLIRWAIRWSKIAMIKESS